METYVSIMMSAVLAATLLTNIIVQVLKQLTWNRIPTNLVAFLVAQAVTLCTFFAVCQVKGIAIVWYTVVAAIAVGFMVAFAAMFGFDKLKELVDQWGGINKLKGGR